MQTVKSTFGVSKRACPVCALALNEIATMLPQMNGNVNVYGSHSQFTARGLPPWLPTAAAQHITNKLEEKLKERLRRVPDILAISTTRKPRKYSSDTLPPSELKPYGGEADNEQAIQSGEDSE